MGEKSELKIKGLSKSYDSGKKKALKDFSVTLTPGIYALLGPNGAGKSTLMNILTDGLRADSGVVFYNGTDVLKMGSAYREVIGYMPQQQGVYDDFTAIAFIVVVLVRLIAPVYKVPFSAEGTLPSVV